MHNNSPLPIRLVFPFLQLIFFCKMQPMIHNLDVTSHHHLSNNLPYLPDYYSLLLQYYLKNHSIL